MSKRKFDYMEFEGYGIVFDAEAYTIQEAIDIFKEDFDYKFEDMNNKRDIDIEVYEIKVKWYARMDESDMWHYDIYDNKENRGIYKVIEDEDFKNERNEKGFKCWRLRYDPVYEHTEEDIELFESMLGKPYDVI